MFKRPMFSLLSFLSRWRQIETFLFSLDRGVNKKKEIRHNTRQEEVSAILYTQSQRKLSPCIYANDPNNPVVQKDHGSK